VNRRPAAAETLARVGPLAARFGVTRLAVLTGLDVIGIPVVAAVRPNSRTVAVHQGKGPSLEQAKVSALMEALECFCAEAQMLPLRLGTVREMRELGEVADVAALPRCRGGPDPAGERLLWVEGRDVATAAPVWVPRELVAADFSLPAPPGAGVFQATTNGLASGNTMDEAVLHGLCEVIERDAMTLWQAAPEARRHATMIDPASVGGPLSTPLLECCREAGVAVAIADVTSDVGVPVLAAMLRDPLGSVQPEIGTACRPDRDAALAGAIAEAAQARLTLISGTRDDLAPEVFEAPAMQRRAEAAALWSGAGSVRSFDQVPTFQNSDELGWLMERLSGVGLARVIAVDLTRPDLGVPVARVVVPGLEGPGEGEHAPGPRLRRLLRAA
jgi:ribosomal protein S12 methylthiotransferase accessory factor